MKGTRGLRMGLLAVTCVAVGMLAQAWLRSGTRVSEARAAEKAAMTPTVLLNITSSGKADPHAVTMALQLAGHALDDGRDVVLFFNVRGVDVPTKSFPDDLAFHAKPIKTLLGELVKKGAEIQVCPHCLQAMDLSKDHLIEGAVVTDRSRLFSRLEGNVVVFTY